ncbi:MAG: LON peptidase substrate-binding domain-containing protein [Acidimicrobiales bacterium]
MELPMFPLGTVLFPSEFMPLHVFEPRYRALAKDCLAGEREFGVVLIERGSDVGGGDTRTGVGTVARIMEVAALPDGRFLLATFGMRRIRVERWLDDAPYPRAEITDFRQPPAGPDADSVYAEVRAVLRRVLALRSELGESVTEATIELADDPGVGSFQAAAVAPLGPIDKQLLLSIPTADERLRVLLRLLAAESDVLQQRLRLG